MVGDHEGQRGIRTRTTPTCSQLILQEPCVERSNELETLKTIQNCPKNMDFRKKKKIFIDFKAL